MRRRERRRQRPAWGGTPAGERRRRRREHACHCSHQHHRSGTLIGRRGLTRAWRRLPSGAEASRSTADSALVGARPGSPRRRELRSSPRLAFAPARPGSARPCVAGQAGRAGLRRSPSARLGLRSGHAGTGEGGGSGVRAASPCCAPPVGSRPVRSVLLWLAASPVPVAESERAEALAARASTAPAALPARLGPPRTVCDNECGVPVRVVYM